MRKENVVGFRVSLYTDSPREVHQIVEPKNSIKRVWIPQTLADQVWIWFEFENFAHKEEYIMTLPKQYQKMFMHNEDIFTQEFVDKWTKS